MMSTVSGFVLGALAAASMTALYADKLNSSLEAAVERYAPALQATEPVVPAAAEMPAKPATVSPAPGPLQTPAPASTPEPDHTTASLEQRWADFAARAGTLRAAGEFPWRNCFRRAAASYELPEPLLLAIASGESNFDPAARSDKDAVGLMQIRWPDTSRHLGVHREADLYDPCTNVNAGARYLQELAGQFDQNLHLTVAAYNYGPGRISKGGIPEGARWYSHYIYQHLQQVLGEPHVATSELLPARPTSATGHQVLISFNIPHRARDFIGFLQGQLPQLNLQQRSEALGRHDVVLFYHSESERRSALDAINTAGVLPLAPRSTSKQYL